MRSMIGRGLVAAVVVLAVGVEARAQCPSATERVRLFPADRSSGVPVNTVLRAEFPATQLPATVPQWLIFYGNGQELEGEARLDGGTATFEPAGGLEPRTAYYGRVTVEATGQYYELSFSTGTERDAAPPRFAGLRSVSWEHAQAWWLQESCSLWRGDGFVLDLTIPEATDDASGDDLVYYVTQTEGPALDGETTVAQVRGDELPLRLFLTEEEGEGRVCYRARVRDLAGRTDTNSRERCVEPIVDQVFHDACAVAAPRPSRRCGSLVALALAALLIVARSRRRR